MNIRNKKKFVVVAFIATTSIIISSCYKDKQSELYPSSSDCSDTSKAGPKFKEVRAIVQAKCGGSGCHLNGAAAKGYNFDGDCKIENYVNAINKYCVDEKTMPQNSGGQAIPLSTAEQDKISAWVAAGGQHSN